MSSFGDIQRATPVAPRRSLSTNVGRYFRPVRTQRPIREPSNVRAIVQGIQGITDYAITKKIEGQREDEADEAEGVFNDAVAVESERLFEAESDNEEILDLEIKSLDPVLGGVEQQTRPSRLAVSQQALAEASRKGVLPEAASPLVHIGQAKQRGLRAALDGSELLENFSADAFTFDPSIGGAKITPMQAGREVWERMKAANPSLGRERDGKENPHYSPTATKTAALTLQDAVRRWKQKGMEHLNRSMSDAVRSESGREFISRSVRALENDGDGVAETLSRSLGHMQDRMHAYGVKLGKAPYEWMQDTVDHLAVKHREDPELRDDYINRFLEAAGQTRVGRSVAQGSPEFNAVERHAMRYVGSSRGSSASGAANTQSRRFFEKDEEFQTHRLDFAKALSDESLADDDTLGNNYIEGVREFVLGRADQEGWNAKKTADALETQVQDAVTLVNKFKAAGATRSSAAKKDVMNSLALFGTDSAESVLEDVLPRLSGMDQVALRGEIYRHRKAEVAMTQGEAGAAVSRQDELVAEVKALDLPADRLNEILDAFAGAKSQFASGLAAAIDGADDPRAAGDNHMAGAGKEAARSAQAILEQAIAEHNEGIQQVADMNREMVRMPVSDRAAFIRRVGRKRGMALFHENQTRTSPDGVIRSFAPTLNEFSERVSRTVQGMDEVLTKSPAEQRGWANLIEKEIAMQLRRDIRAAVDAVGVSGGSVRDTVSELIRRYQENVGEEARGVIKRLNLDKAGAQERYEGEQRLSDLDDAAKTATIDGGAAYKNRLKSHWERALSKSTVAALGTDALDRLATVRASAMSGQPMPMRPFFSRHSIDKVLGIAMGEGVTGTMTAPGSEGMIEGPITYTTKGRDATPQEIYEISILRGRKFDVTKVPEEVQLKPHLLPIPGWKQLLQDREAFYALAPRLGLGDLDQTKEPGEHFQVQALTKLQRRLHMRFGTR